MKIKDIQARSIIRIVDDDKGIREAYRFLLEGEGWFVQTYESSEEFSSNDNPRMPGCILLDIRMPGMSGLQLQNTLIEKSGSLPIIFMTAHGTIEDAVSTVKKGAFDFLTKPVNPDILLRAIESALTRQAEIDEVSSAKAVDAAKLRQLSDRELEVARALASGKLNKTIAYELNISERTIQVHKANIFRKLDIRSPAELASLLIHAGEMP